MLLILIIRLWLSNVAQHYNLVMPLVYLGFGCTTVPCSSKHSKGIRILCEARRPSLGATGRTPDTRILASAC